MSIQSSFSNGFQVPDQRLDSLIRDKKECITDKLGGIIPQTKKLHDKKSLLIDKMSELFSRQCVSVEDKRQLADELNWFEKKVGRFEKKSEFKPHKDEELYIYAVLIPMDEFDKISAKNEEPNSHAVLIPIDELAGPSSEISEKNEEPDSPAILIPTNGSACSIMEQFKKVDGVVFSSLKEDVIRTFLPGKDAKPLNIPIDTSFPQGHLNFIMSQLNEPFESLEESKTMKRFRQAFGNFVEEVQELLSKESEKEQINFISSAHAFFRTSSSNVPELRFLWLIKELKKITPHEAPHGCVSFNFQQLFDVRWTVLNSEGKQAYEMAVRACQNYLDVKFTQQNIQSNKKINPENITIQDLEKEQIIWEKISVCLTVLAKVGWYRKESDPWGYEQDKAYKLKLNEVGYELDDEDWFAPFAIEKIQIDPFGYEEDKAYKLKVYEEGYEPDDKDFAIEVDEVGYEPDDKDYWAHFAIEKIQTCTPLQLFPNRRKFITDIQKMLNLHGELPHDNADMIARLERIVYFHLKEIKSRRDKNPHIPLETIEIKIRTDLKLAPWFTMRVVGSKDESSKDNINTLRAEGEGIEDYDSVFPMAWHLLNGLCSQYLDLHKKIRDQII